MKGLAGALLGGHVQLPCVQGLFYFFFLMFDPTSEHPQTQPLCLPIQGPQATSQSLSRRFRHVFFSGRNTECT